MDFNDKFLSNCNKCGHSACGCNIGPRGPRGNQGPSGDQGPPGPPGGVSEYAYIYKLDQQVVDREADILFSNNGPMTSGITHIEGTSEIVFNTAGIYEINYTVYSRNPHQWTFFLNDMTPIPESIYGNDSGNSETVGIFIVEINTGDVLTLRNHTSTPNQVQIVTNAGGTQNSITASIVIKKLADLP